MGTSPHGQRLVSPKGIGVAHAGRLPRLPDKRQEAVWGRGGDKRRGDLPRPLQQPETDAFARGATPATAFAPPPPIPLVGRDCSRQALARQFARDALAQPEGTPAAVLRWPPMIAAARAVPPATNHFRRAPCL